jgi:hypothetical protein
MSHLEPEDKQETNWVYVPPKDLSQLEFMFELFKAGLIGVKEYRNYLAESDEVFQKIRDASIDNSIDERAREMARLREEEEQRVREDRERRQQALAESRES